MNNAYVSFIHKYGPSLLEGQRRILKKLDQNLFPKLGEIDPEYFPVLARMPTGTGKTGVIAVTAYFGNHNGSTLILTPWKNLCRQMKDDLERDFWKNVGLTDSDRNFCLFPTLRLYPSKIARDLEKQNKERCVIIGTLSGLQSLDRTDKALYEALRAKVSLIVVDEGHYEPAVLWGRAVKGLNRPTLLMTATPYRNDLKLFRVPATRVFHYEHFRAVAAPKVRIREVDSTALAATSNDFEALLKEFTTRWKRDIRAQAPNKDARAIICCDSKKRVREALEIVHQSGIDCLAFHERVEPEDFANNKRLKARFKNTVPPAKETNEDVWIHQHKLTEGLDDARFSVLLLTYPLRNDRTLVQQVGRILRYSKEDRPGSKAIVLHCADYPFAETWANYLEFEKKLDLVTGEHYRQLVLDYLELQPTHEYFGKRFRKRLEPFASLDHVGTKRGRIAPTPLSSPSTQDQNEWKSEAWTSILTPPSVLVLSLRRDFDMAKYLEDTRDALVLRDGVILGVNGDDSPVISVVPNGPILWLYALIRNSTILLRRSVYEITIEARFIHRVREYLFVGDTSGIAAEDYTRRYANASTYFDIVRCLERDYLIRQVGLFNTQSLSTAIRRTVRQGVDLESAPYQISEKKYICQTIRARRPGVIGERYFGLTRGRISDRLGQEERETFNLQRYAQWTESLADLLDRKKISPHSFLSRYAGIASPPTVAVPYALILDPNPDPEIVVEAAASGRDLDELDITWKNVETGELVDLMESVFKFENNDDDDWPYRIVIGGDEPPWTEVLAAYDSLRNTFRFKKGERTDLEVLYRNDVFTVAHLLTSRQDRYAIVLKEPALVYHNRQFFELDYSNAEAKFLAHVERVPALEKTRFEKLPRDISKAQKKKLRKWPEESVFSKALSEVITSNRFGRVDWLFCDDPGKEIADFVAVDFGKRHAAFVHCKYGRGKRLSASAFHDLCSQASKNLVYLRTERLPPNIDNWTRKAFWEGTKIIRWCNGRRSLPENLHMWDKIRRDVLRHPGGTVDVWLIMGNGLDVEYLRKAVKPGAETPEVGPLLHLLDGLTANCAEAGVSLKVFGH
jgi:superfamily II DNA or RNA helicase